MEILSCDLETTTVSESTTATREWAVGVYNIHTEQFEHGTSLEWFFTRLKEIGKCKAYFHNLKFDGGFILDWLFRNGYEFTEDKKLSVGQFNTLISDKNMFYTIKVRLSNDVQVTFLDSQKVIPMSVERAAKAFGLPYSKGEIDYHKSRPHGYLLDDDEVDYLFRDCKIIGMILKILFKQGLDRMTQGSNALASFKKSLPRKFEKIFPPIDCDSEIRPAYKGGFSYAAPQFQGRNMGYGETYDKNSMYPSMMKYKVMPYGKPKHFTGEYEADVVYPLYIQKISVCFDIKENHIPTIQIKSGYGGFIPTEYVTTTNGEEITLTLTNIDLSLLKDQYNIHHIEYIDGWKFQGTTGLFDNYIDYWYEVKEQATRDKNHGMRTLAKLMLNALYGKFATSTTVQGKIPYYDYSEKKVRYKLSDEEDREPVYLPVACFITAYARDDLIRNAQANYDTFAYADTDSLHLIGKNNPDLDIDDYRIGAWSMESRFKRARFLRAKSYIEDIYMEPYKKENVFKSRGPYELGKSKITRLWVATRLKVTCAGMPHNCHKSVTWENFVPGSTYEGKLQSKTVSGGVLLFPTTFKLNI